MLRISSYIFALFLIFSCQKNQYKVVANTENSVSDRPKRVNYFSFLDEQIKNQETFNFKTRKKITFPIKIYEVEPLLGSSLESKDYSGFIDYLNKEFASTLIGFELSEVESFNNSTTLDMLYYNPRLERSSSYGHYDPNVINLYVFNDHQNVIGFTHYPSDNIQRLYISAKMLLDPSVVHEFGHYFGLLHTFEERHLDGHCNYSGDKICDTPKDYANPAFIEAECVLAQSFYTNAEEKLQPDLANYMSYYGTCRKAFSEQQKLRMYYIALKVKLEQLNTEV